MSGPRPREEVFRRVVARMSEPSFHSPPPSRVDVRETHVSVVFLAGDLAYKLKKPVRLPFLDYSTLERRRRFCDEEVRLNRRFAPDIYLCVQAIAERDGELLLADVDDPAAVEYAVVMRRYDDEATLDSLAERGEADEQVAERVGARVAELHIASPRAPADYWTPAYVGERLDENLDTTRPEIGALVDVLTFNSVRRFSHAFLHAHAPLLERRIAEGMVRDVHGDLRAEHVVIEPGGLSLVDCVDFDDRLRCIDVAADLAFLTMDLERLGTRPLAEAVERAYVAHTGDAGLHELLPFYACYRAWVRAKVAALRIRQLDAGDPSRPVLEQRARALFALSLRLAWRARLPLVVVLCGVAGSGKSTLAAELSRRSGLPHLSSDRVRKELAGISADSRAPGQVYTPEFTMQTYRELAARANVAVESSGGAVLDATFHRRDQRALVTDLGTRALWIECIAPEQTLRSRSAARERAPERGSDATWPVAAAQLSAWEPLDEVGPGDRHVVRTDRALEDCLDDVDSFVSGAVDGGWSGRSSAAGIA
jgi:aminoglycoside phosphotransferase family enzyme/predicted kinase